MPNSTDDTPPEMFDHMGQLRPLEDFRPAEIEGLSVDRKAAFDELHNSINGERAKVQAVKDCFTAIKRAQAVADLARLELLKWKPKLGFHDIWKTDVANTVAHTVHTDEEKAEIAKCERALRAAEEHVQICQSEVRIAEQAVRPARARVALALTQFKAQWPIVTPEQAIKAHINHEQEYKLAVKEGRIAAKQQAPHASPLDAQLSGYRGQPGQRYNMARRGGHTQDKFGQTIRKTPDKR